MNRLKSHILFSLITLLLLPCAAPSHAGSIKGATVSIYNSGRALIQESRSVTLPEGLASVVFKDVPTTMDPTSIHAQAAGMTVLDLQYSHLPITTRNLLDRYIGKELTVIIPDPSDANARILRKAVLASNVDRPIFLVGNEVYIGNYEAVLLPDMPKDLQQEPTLTLTTDNTSAGKRDVNLSYLMDGLNWRADYTLTVDKAGTAAALDAWATVTNTSGRSFSATSLKLVAGDVKQEPANRRMYAKATMAMESDMAAASPQPVGEQFSQYHVYSVERLVSLAEAGTKQLSLFSAPKVVVEQTLTSRFHAGAGQRNGSTKQNVDLSISLNNTEKNGLGRPMPGGLVRVFMPTSDGSQLLAGESRIGHVGEGGEVELSIGTAFDVSVERNQTSFKKLGKNSYEMGWQITVINGLDKPQALTVQDMYSGQWEVVTTDHSYTRPDAGTAEFELTVPPTKDGKGLVVNYTVQVTY